MNSGSLNPLPLKKVKFLIYGAILKFETEDFHIFANNNWD